MRTKKNRKYKWNRKRSIHINTKTKTKRNLPININIKNKNVDTQTKYSQFEEDYDNPDVFKKEEATKSEVENKLIHFIKKGIKDRKYLPQDDFYTFITEVWSKKAKLTEEEKYIVQLDDFRLVQFKVYKELIEIIEDYVKNNKTPHAERIDNFYTSVNKGLSKNLFVYHVKKTIQYIDLLRQDKNNLWKLLAFFNSNEMISIGCPFVFKIQSDDKNSGTFRCYINPVHFSLLDLNNYIDDGKNVEHKQNIKSHYLSFLRKLSNIDLGPENADINNTIVPKDVFDIEYQLLISMGCDSIKHVAKDNYNRVSAREALEKYGFNWDDFSKELGFKTTPEFFITGSLNYLKCVTELLLQEWDSEKWRSYWVYLFMRQISRGFDETNFIYFDFFGKFLQGQELPANFPITAVTYTSLPFNEFLTKKYREKFEKAEYIEYVNNMGHDLLKVFKRTMRNNNWLSPKTKKYALMKLEHIKFIIGSPNNIPPDPVIEFSRNDFWDNLNKIFHWRLRQVVHLNGKPVIDIPELDFTQAPAKFIGKQVYVVNAFYTPSENSIFVPLAYIQPPFVDLRERGIEYNLAYLGFTLGHEMSHSMDDMGSKYDYKGNLHDWWTEHDKKEFKKKQANVIQQYEAFALNDGIHFNAASSIGEDLADISGLAICEEYLRDFQDKNQENVPVRILSFKAFFVYFAFQMRQIVQKKAIRAQLFINPHPLDKYRTNVPLSRLQLFRTLYNVKKGDGMYWPSTDKIW